MGFFDIVSGIADIISSGAAKQKEKTIATRRRVAKEHGIDYDEPAPSRSTTGARKRRTDAEFASTAGSITKSPKAYSYKRNVPLRNAKTTAPSEPGVYILYLDGEVMKCGRAAYGQGIAWRFTQYYNLNYDNKARKGDYWTVSPENRDAVTVSWQACPESKCEELEYKLFKKYGKGPWAQRAPKASGSNDWTLLI